MADETTGPENVEEEQPARTSSEENSVPPGDSIQDGAAADGELAANPEATIAPQDFPAVPIEDTENELPAPALPYPVVGFGASAGGLQAFRTVLEGLDPSTGMAFVLVTHLAPDQTSHLTEIIERFTRMPVMHAMDGVRPEPNRIYILLPNQTLRMKGGVFHVTEATGGKRLPRVIDDFFTSLATDQKSHAIGVVLSGAASDGATGLKAIKGEGGITLVQTPETALQEGMPRSSIAADHVDLIIPPGEIALELGRLGHHFARPGVRSLEEGLIAPADEQSYQRILHLLRASSGIEFRQYKPETIRRRIARRMILLRKDNLNDYHRFLQVRADEVRILQEDLLISVTRFFRDPLFWQAITDRVLPTLLAERGMDRPIRVWCAGCATGEEAFSLAILIIEYLSDHNLDVPLQVFATDASEQSIETGRLAIYPESLAVEITPERLRRFFVKVDRGYQVSKPVRDTVIFARQNLCNDPPFSHIDILSCRNVMIYFNRVLQRQLMLTFHYALDPGGYMLVGLSEGLRDYGDMFSTVDRKHKIYMKTGAAVPYTFDINRNYAQTPVQNEDRPAALFSQLANWPEIELQRAADRIVLARFGPPGLIVDERFNVLQSRGQTAPYLELSPGRVSWNLLRILRDGVAIETREAVQRAIHENIPVTSYAVMLDDERGEQRVQIDVFPITTALARTPCFLILFQPVNDPAHPRSLEAPALPGLSVDDKDRMIAQLRQDLGSSRFQLQSLIEERDAHNQELVYANEKIQSAYEELRSTNEELQTTKEELQSANEELQTLNDELQQRNSILTQAANDLTNLLNGVSIPLLMLGNDLRIRHFTPPMQRLLSVRPADIGRSIKEIRLQLSIENIEPLLQEVLDTLGTRELEVRDREGRWNLLRVRPYRTAENKIDGLVVVLLDIDQLRSSQQHVLEARDFARSVVESVPVPIVVLSKTFSLRSANTAFIELTGMPAKELEHRNLPDLVQILWGVDELRPQLEALANGPPNATFELEHESRTPAVKTLIFHGQALNTDGERVLLLVVEDITMSRRAERLLAGEKAALESEVELASHILTRTREELRALTAHLFTIQEEEREHVARELHDDISQRLSLIQMRLGELAIDRLSATDSAALEETKSQLNLLNSSVRDISHRLHPAILKDLGLPVALKALVDEFERHEGMPATFATHNLPEQLPDAASTTIYRITQEALRNVAKHAGRTHVKVNLEGGDDVLQLRVTDFGIGFDQDSDHPSAGLGMISMQERARLAGGTFHFQSALGSGTTITVRVPLTQ